MQFKGAVDRIHINIGDWRIGLVMDAMIMRGFPSLINNV